MPDLNPTINTYVSDMIALERHMLQPMQAQQKDDAVQASPAGRIVSEAVSIVEAHVSALEAHLERIGGHAGVDVKSTVASALGAVASVVGNVRKTEVSKDLRDDYSALSLASISYSMLYATAAGSADSATAELAKRHLTDYATLIMRISDAMPTIVLSELRSMGVAVDVSADQSVSKGLQEAWSAGAQRSGVGA